MPTPIRRGSAALIEQPNSPRWVFGEQLACVRNFATTDYSLALASAPMRGALGTGIVAGMRVRESQVERTRGGAGTLTIAYENFPGTVPGQGSQLPADEAEVVFEKMEHSLKKLGRYKNLTFAQRQAIETLLEVKMDDTAVPAAQNIVFGNELATELFTKLQRGETHKLLYIPVYRLLTHSWTAPLILAPGGNLETPPNFPIVAPPGFEWLREGDRMSFNDTFWIVESRWLAAPIVNGIPGWDHDIYQ